MGWGLAFRLSGKSPNCSVGKLFLPEIETDAGGAAEGLPGTKAAACAFRGLLEEGSDLFALHGETALPLAAEWSTLEIL